MDDVSISLREFVPSKRRGKNNRVGGEREYTDRKMAVDGFDKVKDNLSRPYLWTKLGGKAGANFELFDSRGVRQSGIAKPGNFIRIDIPGPGNTLGGGYDWVKISKIDSWKEDQSVFFGIQLEPATDPQSPGNETAHFLEAGSSSTFVAQLSGTVVRLNYFGRNEQINVGARGLFRKIRNFFVGAGAFIGLSEVQWKSLVDGILKA